MSAWAEPTVWERVHKVFGRFDATDSRRALTETVKLYSELGQQTAEALGYTYPAAVDAAISGYIGEHAPRSDNV